jgi:dipeptidyl aminopeptidase/acylaminoacyl peptidase
MRVSIAGISDPMTYGWRKRNRGQTRVATRTAHDYDPDKDQVRLREVSLAQAARIKIPILLIHGNEDYICANRAIESDEEGA